ncbi:SIMPL domain-containing protein [Corallococcus sp. AB049A]|uniref:SIMPL domain-containing protein n=1 Tax=Corallococcus interemptor TaxID=2316720 RepID=A0A3A8Q6P7_9BACT|nr:MULTISPECIES: SIMPL domain-containing protein [Corallococcus]RKH46508.1 SIMPL domain-containing protein [Corallococcus sp. AB050B]RKH63788.1 SIMPL domain-containing protein [Corallococcus interemptor]RKI65685.1 SIMPL domain-containing protein [Corallococcus sp. AB049A]
MPERAAAESGIIVVELSAEHELEADHVDAVVEVKASSFFTGNAAFANAREVATLVRAMEDLGVQASAFTLQSVQAETTEGLLTRSSSALYLVRIRLVDMARVGDVLAALSGLKQATLRELRWGYTHEAEARQDWLEALARESVKKARRVAAGLGVTVAGLHRFSERTWESQAFGARGGGYGGGTEDVMPMAPSGSYGLKQPRTATLGFPVSHRKKVHVMATAEFQTHPAPAA